MEFNIYKLRNDKTSKQKDKILIGLRIAGKCLRNEDVNRGLSYYPSSYLVRLEDRWFEGKEKTMATVAKALSQHTGISIEYSVTDTGITVDSLSISDEKKYNDTVQKEIDKQEKFDKQMGVSTSTTKTQQKETAAVPSTLFSSASTDEVVIDLTTTKEEESGTLP